MIVRRIGVWSAARIYGAMTACIGLLFGGIVALASMLGAGFAGPEDGPAWLAGLLGIGAVIVLPIAYGVMGLIGGALGALLYNLFAAMVGGVEVDVS